MTAERAIPYPPTARGPQVDDYFGTPIADPYRWLEDDGSAETRAWVEAQNRVTAEHLGRIPFRGALLARLRALADHPKQSAPFRRAGLVFSYRNDGLQNQSVLHVQRGLDGAPEVLLDPNTFSADATIRLESFEPSRDGRWGAYEVTAIAGSDWRELRVVDVARREPLPDVLRWVRFSTTAWRGDGFYYSRYPAPAPGTELTAPTEHQTVWYHRVGTPQSDDVLVAAEPAHSLRFLAVQTTSDERFAVRTAWEPGRRGNDLWVRDERLGETAFRPVVEAIGEEGYDLVDGDGDDLLVLTNRDAPNRRLMRVDPARPSFADWSVLLAERAEPLERVTLAGGRIFAGYLKDVAAQVEVVGLDGTPHDRIALPAPGDAIGFAGDRDDADVFYVFSSLSHPPTVYRYDIAARTSTLFRRAEIAGYDADDVENRQVFFTSRDGTRVPMFIVHKKGLARDGRAPTLLYGYGGFNVTRHPDFNAQRIAWLEQGGVFALASLRGGGEYGEAWHEAGMLLRKQNVFDDCIAAAEHLIAEGYTAPDRLALQGRSNGGLLVGAVINQRPELFAVALPGVGVMDMLRYQKFSVGAAWVAELGSSDDEAQCRYLLGYSPLHNIRAGVRYPATLVTTSDHDDRVVPAHSYKYAATLQATAGDGAPQLIRIDVDSGHAASNLAKTLEEAADLYAFAWDRMGVVPDFDAPTRALRTPA